MSEMIEIKPELAIRPARLSDADCLFALVEQNRRRLRQWMPWADDTRSVDDTIRFLRSCEEDLAAGKALHCVVLVGGEIVGVVGMNRIEEASMSAPVGYWLDGMYEGNGYMTLSCAALIDEVFRRFSLERVEIRTATGNTRSAAIPQRLGFSYVGVIADGEKVGRRLFDLKVYAVSREEWLAREA